jgi:arylsulfatase A
MTTRNSMFWLFLLCFACRPGTAPSADSPRPSLPNVVLILADDLGYGDLGCYGATKIKTPHMDRLAREGMRLTQAYTPGSVCSPTRYSLLAGRYFWRTPLHPETGVLAPAAPLVFERDRLTLGAFLQRHGYTTSCIGKWHLGFGDGTTRQWRYDWSQEEIKPGPLECGFDHFFGMAANVANHPRIYIENHRFAGRKAGDVVKRIDRNSIEPWSPEAEYKSDRVGGDLARQAVQFIQRSKDRPFFLYFASNIPHNDITPAPEFLGQSACGPYGDFVQELDAHVGLIRTALEQAGVADNTLILFTSDNGGVVADNERLAAQWQARQAGHAICGTLRGRKHSVYEGGFRVPFIVRWPGQVPAGGKSDEIICLTDLLASFAALCEQRLPEQAGEDSLNVLPLLKGAPGAKGRSSVILRSAEGVFAIREGDWKLIEKDDSLVLGRKGRPGENENQLYNLAADPSETKNCWNEKPEIVKRLTGLLAQARQADHTRR